MEDILPDAFRRPADETIVERLARAVGRRGIDPAATAFQHMNDPADDTAIINPWFAACVARKMRLNSPVTKSLSDHPISGAITTTSMAIWPSTVAINTSASVSSV